MEEKNDLFLKVMDNAKGGVDLASAIANKGKPVEDVAKSTLLYEVASPLVKKITKLPLAVRQMNYVRPLIGLV